MQKLTATLGATLDSLRSSPSHLPSTPHQNPSTISFVVICRSRVQLHRWLCLPSHPLVSAALFFGNQCAFLFEKHRKKTVETRRVIHGGELLDVEQAIARVWLLLVPNANPCPFWRKQLFLESPDWERRGWVLVFSPKPRAKRSF